MANDLINKKPSTQAKPALELYFKNVPAIAHIDFGRRMSNVQYSCMLNGGYIVRVDLFDPFFNVIGRLVGEGYLKTSRNEPLIIRFRLKASPDGGEFPRAGTSEQIAYVTKVHTYGTHADISNSVFTAVDPASYMLNKGAGSGKSYQGKVSSVIKQVVNEYAPEIQLEISETIDSDKNRFWMMRQDPQTFINSLLEWSSPLVKNKTQWIVASDGYNLHIKEQADIRSRERAYYTFYAGPSANDTILGWDLLADNTLTVSQAQLISQGLSAVSGAYYDRITDEKDQRLIIKDETTDKKIIAATTAEQSFTKPGANSKFLGVSSIPSIPEIYSAGELGIGYDDYISGRARDIWLNLTRRLLRCRLKVIGHGEWSNGLGLGCDTVKLLWMAAGGSGHPSDTEYFMSGNWLVYGFEHELQTKHWYTYLHLARFDWNATADTFPKK